MTPEVFAEWFRRQGNHVVRTQSSYWHSQAMRVYQAFPYFWQIRPAQEEIDKLLRDHRIIGLRYATPLDAPCGMKSYHVGYSAPTCELSDIPKTMAVRKVKKGLKYATVEPISLERLAAEGWALRADTLVRQNRVGAETPAWWARMCHAGIGLEGFEAWGALHDGKLTAALLSFHCEDTICILHQASSTEHLRFGVNNVLDFVFTREKLKLPGVKRLSFGLHSLDAPPTTDRFKLNMNWQAEPIRQRVDFHPLLRLAFNQVAYRAVKWVQARRPNTTLSKVEGMMRFYLQGKVPLDQQPLPELMRGAPDQDED